MVSFLLLKVFRVNARSLVLLSRTFFANAQHVFPRAVPAAVAHSVPARPESLTIFVRGSNTTCHFLEWLKFKLVGRVTAKIVVS